MKGKPEHFELKGRACACFVPENGAECLAVLCGWHMEEMLCALAEEAPQTLLFFAEADGGRDFTPWAAEPVWEDEPFSGGGAEYLRFLTETALPYLEERYALPAVSARRAILGYSLGGLLPCGRCVKRKRSDRQLPFRAPCGIPASLNIFGSICPGKTRGYTFRWETGSLLGAAGAACSRRKDGGDP